MLFPPAAVCTAVVPTTVPAAIIAPAAVAATVFPTVESTTVVPAAAVIYPAVDPAVADSGKFWELSDSEADVARSYLNQFRDEEFVSTHSEEEFLTTLLDKGWIDGKCIEIFMRVMARK